MRVWLRSAGKRSGLFLLVFGLTALAVCWLAGGGRLDAQASASGQAGTAASAQQPAPRASSYIIRSQRTEVLVDVRVHGPGGKPVTDLKQENFRIFEDGVPQTITSFSFENVDRLAQATAEQGPPPTIDLAKLPPNVPPATVLRDHRLVVLFFDLSSMPVDDLMRSVKAAEEFVRKQMTPADLVAVVTYTSSLRVTQDFTNNRDALAKSLKDIRIGEESSALAAAGTEGEAGTTNASGNEVVTQDVSAAFTPDETEFNIFNTDQKLAAVESLARMLRDVPGRKAVLQFTSGVERTGIENQAQLRATTDAANQSNVSLYTVDARGLVALPPGGDATSASPSGTAVYSGSAISSQVSSLHEGRETLATLAADTGGKTFTDLNDFSSIFQEVQNDNASYYLIGYTPSNLRSDGRFRRIRVEVDRKGVKVEARPGYFAPKDFRQFTREDKDLQLQLAMDMETSFLDLPLVVEAAYFRRTGKNYYVVLAAKIPGSAISFLRKSGTRQTEFDFGWSAMDAAKRPVNFLRDTLPVKLSDEAYGQLLASNILYQGGMTLPPGQYRLKVVVRENQSGKLGTFEQALSLPEITATGLALSSVVLSNQLQEATSGGAKAGKNKNASESPLQVGDKLVLPSVTRVFRTNQTLCFYLESYAGKTATPVNAPATPSAPAVPPSVGLAFFRGGAKVAESGPYAGKAEKTANGKTSYFAQMPLAKFPPGRYLMQVNVLDPAAGRVAFSRVPMAVVKPPQPTPAPAPGS